MSRGPRHAVVEAKLPVVQVEIRPGRTVAVHHHRPSSQAAPRARLFFVHGSCGSMLQYEALVCHTGLAPCTSRSATHTSAPRLGQIAHFAAAGHEVVAFDYVGCGRSPKPQSWYAYAFDELQADAAAVVATYGRSSSSATTKNVLVCHSAGCLLGLGLGLVAATGAGAQAPVAAVHGLVLMAPGYVPGYRPLPLFYLPARVLRCATQASNPRLADRVPGRSATQTRVSLGSGLTLPLPLPFNQLDSAEARRRFRGPSAARDHHPPRPRDGGSQGGAGARKGGPPSP